MYIKTLKLKNFRNYKEQVIEFSPKKNIIFGKNGQGKTNIIEAIYFLQNGKSYRSRKEKEVIRFGSDIAYIETDYIKYGNLNKVKFFINEEKSVSINGIMIEKLSELIGGVHSVIFTPDHLNLIKEGPGERRQFLDSFISQLKPLYLKTLIEYYKILKQRNNLLKMDKKYIKDSIFIWDEKLAHASLSLFSCRNDAIRQINEKINNFSIGKDENIKFEYSPSVKGDFLDIENIKKQLSSNLDKDIEKGITLTGPHRDDFNIFMNDINIKNYGSQGQIKTCVLKLKLTECEIIKEKTSEEPILLLDDVLSELDEERKSFFLEKINDKQVIITCAQKENVDGDCALFSVSNGVCIREN